MPNPHDSAVEQVIRDLIDENPDLPIRADFYRGISPTPLNMWGDRILREYAETPDCPREWFVRLMVNDLDVCVSAAGRYEWGAHDVIGEVTAVPLPQPTGMFEELDLAALTRPGFKAVLLAAVQEKAAVVAEMRAHIHA